MRISIVTINFNNEKGLQKTINSVISQTYGDIEYIVIDGGSTDDSEKIIKKYEKYLKYWVSEEDSGIYNAMNKGLRNATGQYCLFLNSGDFLASDTTISQVVDEMVNQPNFDLYYGDLILYNEKTKLSNNHIYPLQLSLNYFYNTTIGHPSSFISTRLLNAMHGYDESYQIISDWLFFIKAFLNQAKFKKIPFFISVYDMDGISANGELVHKEKRFAFEHDLSNFMLDFLIFEELSGYKRSRLHNLVNSILVFFGRRHKS